MGESTAIGTAGEANHDYLRSLGTIPVAYGPGLVERLRAIASNAALGFEVDGLRATLEIAHDPERVVTMPFSDEIAAHSIRDWTGVRSAEGLIEMLACHRRAKFLCTSERTAPWTTPRRHSVTSGAGTAEARS
ncbi:hypothetical protein [Nonomuraea aurantiaca]|uniref:hypothetical protein n=1 Tax=Nonomuraea aurantiaca TaxID=2878562 RepID=UPI001CD92AEA|nr:hypothetical protein [Nonomuraea aurantiaca]MCA2230360.1 hypothetical protein [Nonomuraea aurantiaca]